MGEQSFSLESLGITVQVADIYRRLTIPAETRRVIPVEIREPLEDEPDDEA